MLPATCCLVCGTHLDLASEQNSHMPFWAILSYARFMGIVRLFPGIGAIAEKVRCCVQGDVPVIQGETVFSRLKRRYKTTVLNTFDSFGSHAYQHHKREDEIRLLISSLQPEAKKILNVDKYFSRPTPIGCALRIFR